MIQRIQSIYLILAAVALAAVLFLNGVWQQAASSFALFTFLFVAMGAAASLVAFTAVFLYSNRPRQRWLVAVAQALALAEAVVLYVGLYLAGVLRYTSPAGQIAVNRVIALLLPIVGYVLLYLARRAITKDIELVRSMDRLR